MGETVEFGYAYVCKMLGIPYAPFVEESTYKELVRSQSGWLSCNTWQGNGLNSTRFVPMRGSLGVLDDRYRTRWLTMLTLRYLRRIKYTTKPASRTRTVGEIHYDFIMEIHDRILNRRNIRPYVMYTYFKVKLDYSKNWEAGYFVESNTSAFNNKRDYHEEVKLTKRQKEQAYLQAMIELGLISQESLK